MNTELQSKSLRCFNLSLQAYGILRFSDKFIVVNGSPYLQINTFFLFA